MRCKRFMAVLVALSLSVLFVFPAFASIATPSDAELSVASPSEIATSSNAFPSQDYMEMDSFDTLDAPVFLSAGDDIENTVDLSSVTVTLMYQNMSGVNKEVSKKLDSSGYFSFSRPSDYAGYASLGFVLNSGALPPSGKYNMRFHFGSNTGGFTYGSSALYLAKTNKNTSLQASAVPVDIIYSSGDFSWSKIIDFSSLSYIQFHLNINDMYFPYGGYTKINFTPTSANSDIQGPSVSNDQIQNNIANNMAQQVEQGDTIIELIKNTIQTISSQLTAFWNQLAGEFTNLFNKMNQQHSEQLQADRENTDDIIAAEESNTTNIINNNNANTDKITGGYDNSGMLSENDRLNNSLNEYQKQEDEVFNQAKDKVNSFEYGNHFDKFTAPLADISFFLTGIYDGLGSLNVPIAFALTLSVSLLAIGYYRFKSGS